MIEKLIQAGAVGAIAAIVVFLLGVAAWFQHLYTSFNEEAWGFLIASAIFFPIAIIHGLGIWLGLW